MERTRGRKPKRLRHHPAGCACRVCIFWRRKVREAAGRREPWAIQEVLLEDTPPALEVRGGEA